MEGNLATRLRSRRGSEKSLHINVFVATLITDKDHCKVAFVIHGDVREVLRTRGGRIDSELVADHRPTAIIAASIDSLTASVAIALIPRNNEVSDVIHCDDRISVIIERRIVSSDQDLTTQRIRGGIKTPEEHLSIRAGLLSTLPCNDKLSVIRHRHRRPANINATVSTDLKVRSLSHPGAVISLPDDMARTVVCPYDNEIAIRVHGCRGMLLRQCCHCVDSKFTRYGRAGGIVNSSPDAIAATITAQPCDDIPAVLTHRYRRSTLAAGCRGVNKDFPRHGCPRRVVPSSINA